MIKVKIEKMIKGFAVPLLLILFFSGISFSQNPQWIIYTPDNSGIPSWDITDIAFDSSNVKWIASWNRGLIKFNGTNWFTYDTLNSGIPSNRIKTIKIDKKNILWIGTNNGLARFDGVNWIVWDTSLCKSIWEIDVDNNNTKWMATTNTGLLKYNDTTMIFYRTDNSGIHTNLLTGIVLEKNVKWLSTAYNGLIKYNDTTFVNYTYLNSGIGSNYLRCISIDHNGDKWIGKQADFFVKFDSYNNIWTRYDDIWPGLSGGLGWYVYNDSRNVKWFGTNNGLFNFNDTTLLFLNPPISCDIFRYFREDRYNNVWFCTGCGLFVHNPNGVVSVKEVNNLIVEKFHVHQNYPNPFNSQTSVKFELSKIGNIEISLYDILGRKLSTLINEYKQSGSYNYNFNFNSLSSGIYFMRFDFEGDMIIKQIVLIK